MRKAEVLWRYLRNDRDSQKIEIRIGNQSLILLYQLAYCRTIEGWQGTAEGLEQFLTQLRNMVCHQSRKVVTQRFPNFAFLFDKITPDKLATLSGASKTEENFLLIKLSLPRIPQAHQREYSSSFTLVFDRDGRLFAIRCNAMLLKTVLEYLTTI
ncbi:MAG: hypothetical protein PVJ09_04325 [Candidatus Woesebacteria bacterium]